MWKIYVWLKGSDPQSMVVEIRMQYNGVLFSFDDDKKGKKFDSKLFRCLGTYLSIEFC